VPISVQDLKHAVEFVKREAGDAGMTGEGYAQIVSALFDKVHPLALGAIEQSYALSKLITKRMLATHMNEENESAEIERLADAFCDDYKSHQFPIGLLEVRRLHLRSVQEATDDLYEAMWKLLTYYQNIDRAPRPVSQSVHLPNLPAGSSSHMVLNGHIDSAKLRIDCQSVYVGAPGQPVTPFGSSWISLAD
jgi:hypothetical protein